MITFPHGHYLHECLTSRCIWPDRPTRPHVVPDFPILIEHIGGGAGPEGFAAFVWPDEMHTVALMSNDHDDEPVEDFTEEVCFWRALTEMLGDYQILPDFPPKNKYTEQLNLSLVMYQDGLGGKFARVAWEHDIDDVCLDITNGGLES